MNQQGIERDAYYYASESQKRTIKRLRRDGWDIVGQANQAEKVFMVRVHRTGPNDECDVLRDGSVQK